VKMRTALNTLNLLPMNYNNTYIIHPYYVQMAGYVDKWTGIQSYHPDVVDWVLVSLQEEIIDPNTTFYKTPALLLKDGTVDFYTPITDSDIDFNSISDFYIVIEHRNHLPVATPQKLDIGNGNVQFDFTIQSGYASSQKEVALGVFVMYGGNMSHNACIAGDSTHEFEEISGADKIPFSENNGNFYIYHSTDTNLNGEVSGADKTIWGNSNGVFSLIPRSKKRSILMILSLTKLQKLTET